MTDEAKKKRAEYQKAWRNKNPEKVKQYHVDYWERKAAKDGEKNSGK